MCKISLSTKQQEIANYLEGPLLVTASAGSGKTCVLTERIGNLAEHTKKQILAITFTNKACEEIKHRIQSKNYDLLERVNVTTFHGFCMQVLEAHVGAMHWQSMPQIFRDEDIRQVIVSAFCESPLLCNDYLSRDNKSKIQLVNDVISVISQIKREMILPEDIDYRVTDTKIKEVYSLYIEYMESLHAIDFDDLLLKTYQLFLNNPKIVLLYRREYAYICVDEAQDMNKAQYQLLRALTGNEHRNIMLVGDAKQSIYAFNGSSSDFMTKNFVKDYSPVRQIELFENYRSAKAVNDYARRTMPDAPSEEYIKLEGLCAETEYSTPCEEAQKVVAKIQELIASPQVKDVEGKLTCSDIAILARNKFVLAKFEKELDNAQIPFVYKNSSGQISFTSTSACIFDMALMVKLNEMDDLHFEKLKQIIKTKDAKDLASISDKTDIEFYRLILKSVLSLKQDGANFISVVNHLLEYIKKQSKSKQLDDQELMMAYDDFLEIRQHWKKYVSTVNTPSLGAFRNAMALGQTASVSPEDAISLATVHTMKGQQAVVVFLVGMDDGTFPDYRAVKAGTSSSEMQQERNNLYVAVTRAQRHLYISYPKKRKMPWGDWSIRKRSSLLPKM